MIAMVFALTGLVVFTITYFEHINGRLLEALQDPFVITIFLFPFLPAVILSMVARNAQKKLEKSKPTK